MKRHLLFHLLCALVIAAVFSAPSPLSAADSASVKKLFANPAREYATAPLWVWNDMLTEEQVITSLRELAAQDVKQVFVHPRPGLMTPYLSDQWFALWKATLKEAERLDMNVWIYDENSYPSGFAGGWVPQLMPESRGRGLHVQASKQPPKWDGAIVAVYRMLPSAAENITQQVKEGKATGAGEYLTYIVRRAGNSPWHGDRCYVDLLYPGVTQKFLEVTLDRYKKEIGDQFGKRVLGTFTDEPELRPAGGFPWTDDLPQQFEKRCGYKLTDNLASLSRNVGDYKRIRHDYYQTLLDLFIERWGKPYYDYCEKNNLEFTGHYWEHEWPRCISVPDSMAMSAWQQRPGIDILMNQYSEDVHAQFGNVRAVKEIASIANQLGRKRTICEAYGAGGWDLRFEDMKRIGDWMYALGVNTMDEHLSYVTLRGARKADHPQSFSYHEPWWEAYHVSAKYFARLSAAMSSGEQINDILVIEPTTTAWMYNTDAGNDPKLAEIGRSFQKLVTDLEKAQVEFDLGCEDVIAKHGSVEGKAFVVGKRKYTTVVLPPNTENLNGKTAEFLERFANAGGTVICWGDLPTHIDGKASERIKGIAVSKRRIEVSIAERPLLDPEEGDKGVLFHHRRCLDDGYLVLLVNTSNTASARGTIATTRRSSAERWDLASGAVHQYPVKTTTIDGIVTTETKYDVPPCGSLLLFLSERESTAVAPAPPQLKAIQPAAAPAIKRIGPNVLTLDYVDITAGGETKTGTYFYQANQFAFQKNGMPRNPWDSAVQYKDELITKTLPANSGFEATYRFTIAEKVPANLQIVIERPDLYTITCNGKPISAEKGKWWLDRAFGRIDIASAARVGENVVTIKASPFTIYHELQPAYVIGDFALQSADKGFVIVPDRELKLSRWNEQGMPFYAEGISYTETFDVPESSKSAEVSLPSWYGSVAKVNVNGKLAGYIVSQPYALDISQQIKPRRNTIEVIVIGTLKNTLGPHHGNPPVGLAWPAMFHQGPKEGQPAGSKYSTVGYGLFEPFVVKVGG